MARTKIIINLVNLKNNLSAIRKQVGPEKKICLPVEADAYSHGAVEMAKAGLEVGVDYLGVTKIKEGKILRENSIDGPILLRSNITERDISDAVEAGLTLILSDLEHIKTAEFQSQFNTTITSIHLCIHTELPEAEALPLAFETAAYIDNSPSLKLEGLVASMGTGIGKSEVQRQKQCILGVAEALKQSGIDYGLVHVSDLEENPFDPDYPFDLIHPGLMPYGYPSKNQLLKDFTVQRVMKIVAPIIRIEKIKGSHIGVLAWGYLEGCNRQLAGKGEVLLNRKRYPLIGEIDLNHSLVDLGANSTVKENYNAIIIGDFGKAPGADELAEICGTIPQEIFCNINKDILKRYVSMEL